MSNNAEEQSIPKLLDDVPYSKLPSLQDLAISFISNNPHVIFIEAKSELNFRDGVFLPSVLADALFHHLLYNPRNPSINAEKIISTFADSSSCCLQKCQLNNLEFSSDCLYNLCQSQNIQVLELLNVTFNDDIPRINFMEIIKLCGNRLLSFHLRDVSPNPGIQSFQYVRSNTHPFLKSIKLCEKSSWRFVMNEQVPMPLVSLELNDVEFHRYCDINPITYVNISNIFFDRPDENEAVIWMTRSRVPDVALKGDNGDDITEFQAKKRLLETAQQPCFEDVNIWLRSLKCFSYSLDSARNTLLSLSLFNSDFEANDFQAIFQLQRLQLCQIHSSVLHLAVNSNSTSRHFLGSDLPSCFRHLDIGCFSIGGVRSKERPSTYTVQDILEKLPNLISLDVSSTTIGDKLYIGGKFKHITGERCLGWPVKRKLEFLGLSETEGCEVVDIYALAHQISGYHSEHQIMTALKRYRDRPQMLTTSYNDLYRTNRHHSISCPHKVLQLLIDALQRYPYNEELSLSCTANLYFLSREHYMTYTVQQRNELVLTIIRCLNNQENNKLVVRNLILTLYHFEIPGDFIFQFGFITRTLLSILVVHQSSPEVNTLAINMCNTLVSSMKHDMKSEVVKYDFVPTIVKIIERRLHSRTADEVAQVSWGTLWNVTDETPENSRLFVELQGLQLIMSYFQHFEEGGEIHKNMMGLVGNIAEVDFLRPNIMSSGLMPIFYNLLIEEDQNLEVSYNVAGTMAHLLSDGPMAWTCETLSRDVVKQNMYSVIESWDVNASRSINYRSFKPILGLIHCDVAECVHWAVWALCNLSSLDNRYCSLLAKENGLEILATVETKQVTTKTKELTRKIIERVQDFLMETASG